MAQFDSTTKIQVLIDEDTKHGKYKDALYYDVDVFNSMSDADITKAKKDRKDKWVQKMDERALEIAKEPTPEEIQAQIDALEAEIARQQAVLDGMTP